MAMELDTFNDSDYQTDNALSIQTCYDQSDYDEHDEDNDIDIDPEIISQTTLFSKLVITKNKVNNNDLSKYQSPKKKFKGRTKSKSRTIAECRIEKDLEEINKSKWKSFGCNAMYASSLIFVFFYSTNKYISLYIHKKY